MTKPTNAGGIILRDTGRYHTGRNNPCCCFHLLIVHLQKCPQKIILDIKLNMFNYVFWEAEGSWKSCKARQRV